MAGIILYSEKTKSVLELAAAARQIAGAGGRDIKAVTLNNAGQAKELSEKGLNTVMLGCPAITSADTAGLAGVLKQAAEELDADTILLSADRRGKELAGRLAEAWGAGCLTDVKGIALEGDQLLFVRNALGGATVATLKFKTVRRVIVLSPQAFAPWEGSDTTGTIQTIEASQEPSSVKLLETRMKDRDSVDIKAADRLVVVGQGMETQEATTLAGKIAKRLQAEVACSKPVATDRKWFSEDRIVGLSGSICKPELAVVLGVSGQVQFVVGIRDSKTIVSINHDENAFMNTLADYVLVADLKNVLPELEKALG